MQLIHEPFLQLTARRDIQYRSHLQLLVLFKAFSALLAGDSSLQSVGELTDALMETPAYDFMATQLKTDPACAALIRDRYSPPAHDLDQLLTYPVESLGYQYAATMKAKGFEPNLHAAIVADSDGSYVELRLSQTHDIWHIVTEFDTSILGEIGLQAFHLTQFPYPLASMLVANSLMSTTLLAPEELPSFVQAIYQGLHLGNHAKALFAQKWEEGFERPLGEWQRSVGCDRLAANSV